MQQEADRHHQGRGDQGAERRDAEDKGGQQPQAAGDQAHRPAGAEQGAQESRDPFAAPEFQPYREQVAEKRRRAGQGHRRLPGLEVEPQKMGDQKRQADGGRALAGVAQEGDGRQVLAAGAQHIGRADIARTDTADVDAGQPRRDIAERHGSQKVSADNGDGVDGKGGQGQKQSFLNFEYDSAVDQGRQDLAL